MNKDVLKWLQEPPFDDPAALRLKPKFSYEDWFNRGRVLPGSVETLVELLEKEDLEHPSGNGMRAAYALGWIGDKRPRAIDALLRAIGSKDITLRIEAVAALGRLGDPRALPTLEKLLQDKAEDTNVRANACIALGHLDGPSAARLLRETLQDRDPFVARCAGEGLRMLGGSAPPPSHP